METPPVTESLAAFQSRLGDALRGAGSCPLNPNSEGFRFTMAVRRSWCEGRAFLAARAVLMLLPVSDRQCLVREYVDGGGGLAWFAAAETEAFLAFLAPRLPNPSHAQTACRVGQALARARKGALTFAPPSPQAGAWFVDRGHHAALIRFHADPAAIMKAFDGGKVPPVGAPDYPVLVAPGLPNLYRSATDEEAALWDRLPAANAPAPLASALLSEGVLRLSTGPAV